MEKEEMVDWLMWFIELWEDSAEIEHAKLSKMYESWLIEVGLESYEGDALDLIYYLKS